MCQRAAIVLLIALLIAASITLNSFLHFYPRLLGIAVIDVQYRIDSERKTTSQLAIQVKEEKSTLIATDWYAAGQHLARIYPPWRARHDDDPFGWCVNDTNDDSSDGLLFIKIHKCASSTGAGVSLNIAHNVARRNKSNVTREKCKASVGHHKTQQYSIPSRNRSKSFLWTLLRHPASRSLSHYYFKKVSREKQIPTDERLLEFVGEQKNFQLASLQESSLHNYALEQIMLEMDFVGVVERIKESLVVLQMLLGLEASDMIVLSSKRAGGYDASRECHKIVPSKASPFVQEYLDTSFQVDNLDYVLYAAANASLDRTIEALGRERVEREVKRHEYLQHVAEKECLQKAIFPCSKDGVYQASLSSKSCYVYKRDWGCGHSCIYEALQSLEKEESARHKMIDE